MYLITRIIPLLIFVFISFSGNSQVYNIKDKTKYYTNNVIQFNNYSSNGWRLIDKKQLKPIAKALDISIEEAEKAIEGTYLKNHPVAKNDDDVAYIMYKVCEISGYKNGIYEYTDVNDVLCLMYVPNDLNMHMPKDKLAENGKGFFQMVLKENISTSPLNSTYFEPWYILKRGPYSFGFKFTASATDSVVVKKVIRTSYAEKAGLKVGDIIVSVNDKNIRYATTNNALSTFKECGFNNNKFKVLRSGTEITLSIDKINAERIEMVCASANCQNGDCVFEHINGYTIKGRCVNGKIEGKAQYLTEDGFVFYEGAVRNYADKLKDYNIKYEGFGIERYKSGDVYEGEFKFGKKDGKGKYTYKDGRVLEGIWKENEYFDDVKMGFTADRFDKYFNLEVYLHNQKKPFLINTEAVKFKAGQTQKLKDRYKLSDAELDKLLKLCDFKYKPNNMNTPEKFMSIVNKNQKEHPYEVYLLENLEGEDGEFYSIIRIPGGDKTAWLPDEMKFGNNESLYFLAPYSEVKLVDYYKAEEYKKQEEAAAYWKSTEERNAKANAETFEWRRNNELKGSMIYQYSFWNSQLNREDFTYKVVTIFGPPDQDITKEDEINMDKLVGGKPYAIVYKEDYDDVESEQYITKQTGSHRFSVNTGYNYTIPKRYASSSTNTPSYKQADDAVKEAQKKVDAAMKDLLDGKSLDRTELIQKSTTDIFRGMNFIEKDTEVTVIDVPSSDKFYNENKKYIGKTGTVEMLTENGDGTHYGMIKFAGEKNAAVFYKVKININK